MDHCPDPARWNGAGLLNMLNINIWRRAEEYILQGQAKGQGQDIVSYYHFWYDFIIPPNESIFLVVRPSLSFSLFPELFET